MSPIQFAAIVGAGQKWIQNVRRLLARPARNSATEARWFGLVHALHTGLACTLREGARVADLCVAADANRRWLHVGVDESARAELVIDLWRDHSIFLARLSWSTANPVRELRGRRSAHQATRRSAIVRATEYGVDVARLRAGLARTVSERLARLDDNAAFLAAGRASLVRQRA